jgi:hypothetical protein
MPNDNKQDLKDAEVIVTAVMKKFDDGLKKELPGSWMDESERLKWRSFLLVKTYFNLNQGKRLFKKDWLANAPLRNFILDTAEAHAVFTGQTIKAAGKDKAAFLDVIATLDQAKAKCLSTVAREKILGFVCDI